MTKQRFSGNYWDRYHCGSCWEDWFRYIWTSWECYCPCW